MTNVHFRGISGVVRRAVNKGVLVGKIEAHQVRGLLPEAKKAAPDSAILKSLKYLADLNEIDERNGEFFVKSMIVISGQQVSIIGELISVKVSNGKSIVTVEVVEMENL